MSNRRCTPYCMCAPDDHRLVVDCKRRLHRFWVKRSYLRCLLCDLKLGPLATVSPVRGTSGKDRSPLALFRFIPSFVPEQDF
jgi:hypothetical protein